MVTKLDESYEEPSQENKQNNPSFVSLPDEIILNCLARISRSYYPRLSLVCKTFRSLIVSRDLNLTRYELKTHETVVYVYLQFPNSHHPSLFTLWIKPGKILNNQLEEKERLSTGDVRLVQTPSSYVSCIPIFSVSVGSERYGLRQSDDPSSIIYILSKGIYGYLWREATNMTVARAKPLACDLNGKLYVMGGCVGKKSTNSGEVFDPKTQSWEALPVPSPELRFSSIRTIEAIEGKLYVRSNEKKDSVYDPETGEWKVAPKLLFLECAIDNVWYRCDRNLRCSWYDTNREEWRDVRGLAMLNKYGNITGMPEIANYGGKLLILWDKISFSQLGYSYKHIWCAMIALERRDGTTVDEVWGNIEWANIVHTVPSSCVFLRSVLKRV
ncbi:PREDICTED: putative F-box/kelch-repeat protein At5g28160 [Camelina sativa]|uniref:F-box/kelch-repeat protein At5g28160 n=1 Tax=Camelina sativa TaxID=90675 RepID=A0ABM0Z6D8_CAMSA|nr:PREDICTED: putative F-box/kelch-repeat protein At5g28160 [Camelina sativa]